jgi:hypothetical protein
MDNKFEYLLNMNNKIPIKHYFEETSKLFTLKIKSSFIEFFIIYYVNCVNKIPLSKLITYNVIKHIDEFDALSNKYKFILDIDFWIINLEYLLSLDTFKYCIILANNQYSKSFIFLERCLFYYQSYQIKLLNIENFSIREDIKYINECNIEKDKIINNLKNNINIQDILKNIISNISNDFNTQDQHQILEYFVLMKKIDKIYYVIRSQEKNINKIISKKKKSGYFIVEIENIANSVYFWNIIKNTLIQTNKIKCTYNHVELINIEDSEFILIIKHIFAEYKNNLI